MEVWDRLSVPLQVVYVTLEPLQGVGNALRADFRNRDPVFEVYFGVVDGGRCEGLGWKGSGAPSFRKLRS